MTAVNEVAAPISQDLVTQLIRIADDHLVIGHRLSQWCGHAPILEEDLAMPNIALDLLGQARALYTYAGELEGAGRDEDAIAYNRLEHEYNNLLVCECPNGDFAYTMLRQYFFSAYMEAYWQEALNSSDTTVAAIAGKAVKESNYHVRHTAQWVIRLGDGTDESAQRSANAMQLITPYLKELFEGDAVSAAAAKNAALPTPESLESPWLDAITDVLQQANLPVPEYNLGHTGGRSGRHTEHMGYLLAELQFLQRSYPNMQW